MQRIIDQICPVRDQIDGLLHGSYSLITVQQIDTFCCPDPV
jgi:hypothetical protein